MPGLRGASCISLVRAQLRYFRFAHWLGPEIPCLFILMELANGGNLEDYLHPSEPEEADRKTRRKRQTTATTCPSGFTIQDGRQVRCLSSDQIWNLFLGVCRGLSHLHKHGIIHRDLVRVDLRTGILIDE